jgi:hypothetical protein
LIGLLQKDRKDRCTLEDVMKHKFIETEVGADLFELRNKTDSSVTKFKAFSLTSEEPVMRELERAGSPKYC